MPTLIQLKAFAEQNNHVQGLTVVNKYIKETSESWTKGKYYLGGQLPLGLEDTITEENLTFVRKCQEKFGCPCNSWELGSMQQSGEDFSVIEKLITEILTK